MRQLKAEYYKMKYSRASKWVLVFMAFIFFIPFVVGNDTLFMTFGDYRNIDSIGWICYIDDMNNVKAAEIARFALSINFFSWIGLIVYITTMVSAEFHQGTIRASVVYGINRTKLFLSKLLVINVHFFILYYIVETALGLGLAWKYGFHYKGEEFLIFIGMVTLNMIAMIGMEAVAVLITVLVKNTGIVAALSCVYFFAGAITYPTEVNINRKHSYKKITLWRLALLSVQRNKKKTFLTILSLGICGIVLMASSSYLNSIDPYNMAKKSMPNGEIKIELGTYGPQSYTSKQYFDLQKNNILNQELLKKLEDMQAVESIKQYKGTVCDITLPNGDTDIFVVDGIQSGDITNLKKFLVDGEIDFKKMQQKNGIVVSEASEWETLWDWEVKIGDTINILDSEGVPVKYEVVGIVENGADYGGYNMVYMPLSNMEELRKDVLNLTYQLSIKTTSDTNVSKTEDMIRKMFQNEMPIQFTTIDDVAASYKQRIDAYRKPVYVCKEGEEKIHTARTTYSLCNLSGIFYSTFYYRCIVVTEYQ